LAKQGNGNIEL